MRTLEIDTYATCSGTLYPSYPTACPHVSGHERGLPMKDLQRTYLELLHIARRLIASPEVEARWDQPSALPEYRMDALAGHLLHAATPRVPSRNLGPERLHKPLLASSHNGWSSQQAFALMRGAHSYPYCSSLATR